MINAATAISNSDSARSLARCLEFSYYFPWVKDEEREECAKPPAAPPLKPHRHHARRALNESTTAHGSRGFCCTAHGQPHPAIPAPESRQHHPSPSRRRRSCPGTEAAVTVSPSNAVIPAPDRTARSSGTASARSRPQLGRICLYARNAGSRWWVFIQRQRLRSAAQCEDAIQSSQVRPDSPISVNSHVSWRSAARRG